MSKNFAISTEKAFLNVAGLQVELHLWERMWRDQHAGQAHIPNRSSDTLKLVKSQAFVSIFTILQIVATVPTSSSSCEPSISTLRNFKNYFKRNSMGKGKTKWKGLGIDALTRRHFGCFGVLVILVFWCEFNYFPISYPRRMRMANISQEEENNG